VSREAMAELILEWYEDARLLPRPIAGGLPNDSLLTVTVRSLDGVEIFSSPARYPETFAASDTLGPDLGSLVIQAAIRPDQAAQLVIGGLPKSRLPLLITLLVLTLGVGGAALLQIRRERELALLREDFVSGVSHELRTPLAQIRMFAELQDTGKLSSDNDRARAAAVINREARRLTHMVENILQYSRLRRAPGKGLPEEPVDVGEAFSESLEAIRPLAGARGTALIVDGDPNPRVLANRAALNQILVNLLDNAIKYGPAGQTVRATVESLDDVVRFQVDDEGPGIPPHDRQRVWEPYRRLERDVQSRLPGTGIGLAVVARLAHLHGGRAWVEEAPGGGARFVVELPRAPDQPPTDGRAPEDAASPARSP
jgi:signal transduction histidine kinase